MYGAKYELLQPQEQRNVGPGCSQLADGVDTQLACSPCAGDGLTERRAGAGAGPAYAIWFCAERGSQRFPCTRETLVWLIPVSTAGV